MSIQTSGDLRKYLCELLQRCDERDVDLNAIKTQVKVAEKITENLYAELKFKKLAVESGQTSVALGQLKLHGE